MKVKPVSDELESVSSTIKDKKRPLNEGKLKVFQFQPKLTPKGKVN